MSLKQSVVIVNEFTTKTKNGGTRGGTPGDYVTRYMARDKAVEDLTPVRLEDTDMYIERYMARKEAAESVSSVPEMKDKMRKAQGNGGVAFGYGDVSLSDERLKAVSKDIQQNFENGKTVMKTVISFDEDYLRQHGIIDEDFKCRKRGDYRGNIDQMKLRMAIMNGMQRMARDYDDLQYVGVIQVDTKHVHCHLAMVDRGHGRLASDGTQKGMLSANAKKQLRYGIDMYLDQEQKIRMMTSNITNDKRNALCFIKKFTHRTMEQQGTPQFLLACLPPDRRMWRAGSNSKEMQKPNRIVREYVLDVLEQPNSGYREALREVDNYAEHRRRNEGLSGTEYQRLIRNGQERIVQDCMNGVYSVLKQIPREQMNVRTPMLSAMAMDYDDMAAQAASDPMMEFGFKLRSYSSRLQHHKKEMHKYRDAKEDYDSNPSVSEDSKPMRDFFAFEEQYNAMLMCKYQYFLSFLPSKDDYEDDFEELMSYRHRVARFRKMKDDKSLLRMTPDRAEDYGRRVYDMHGGRFAQQSPQVLDRRLEQMEKRYDDMEREFKERLADDGLMLDEHGVTAKKPYDFDDVKALDIHHLGYDWPYNVMVSKLNVDKFVDTANKRYVLYQGAVAYLNASGQTEAISALPNADVQAMKEVADGLSLTGTLVATRPSGEGKRMKRTIPLGINYAHTMEDAVKQTVRAVQLIE